jgi:hypothetical protein
MIEIVFFSISEDVNRFLRTGSILTVGDRILWTYGIFLNGWHNREVCFCTQMEDKNILSFEMEVCPE